MWCDYRIEMIERVVKWSNHVYQSIKCAPNIMLNSVEPSNNWQKDKN